MRKNANNSTQIDINILKRVHSIHSENFNINPRTGNVTLINHQSRSEFIDYFEKLLKSDKVLMRNPEQARSALTAIEINNKVQFVIAATLKSPSYKNKTKQEQIETIGRIGASTVATALITNVAEMSNSIGVKNKRMAAETAIATINNLDISVKQFEVLNSKVLKNNQLSDKQVKTIAAKSMEQIAQKAPELLKEAQKTIESESKPKWVNAIPSKHNVNANNNNELRFYNNVMNRYKEPAQKEEDGNISKEKAKRWVERSKRADVRNIKWNTI